MHRSDAFRFWRVKEDGDEGFSNLPVFIELKYSASQSKAACSTSAFVTKLRSLLFSITKSSQILNVNNNNTSLTLTATKPSS